MQNYFLPSNPTLPPNTVVLQLAPRDDLRGFGENSLDFNRHNRVSGQVRLMAAPAKVAPFATKLATLKVGKMSGASRRSMSV